MSPSKSLGVLAALCSSDDTAAPLVVTRSKRILQEPRGRAACETQSQAPGSRGAELTAGELHTQTRSRALHGQVAAGMGQTKRIKYLFEPVTIEFLVCIACERSGLLL